MNIKDDIRNEILNIGLNPDKCAKDVTGRHLIKERFLLRLGTGSFQASLLNYNMLNGEVLR